MRVLQVTPRYPPQSGGVETHVREVAERLVDRGHAVTVLTADAGDDGQQRERRNGVRVRRYHGLAPGNAFHVCPRIAAAVHRADVDVVHAHNYHSLPLFFAAVGARDRRFVVTPHYHGGSADPLRDRLLSLYRRPGGWAVREADEVIAVSDWERERLARDLGVAASVIPNGLDATRFATATPRGRDSPYLLTVGRLEEYKGVQHVIRALVEQPAYDLLIAGSGPYRERLERTAEREGVADRVEFLGYVDDDALPSLYAGADAYVTLSAFEAYGMTVAEALAAGTPCVVRAMGALTDWIDDEGCIGVESVDPPAVAAAVSRATACDLSPRELPTWDDVVTDLLDRYEPA